MREGDTAPDFELPDQDGRPVRLSDSRGRRVVLYFYPKAETPGCTTLRRFADKHDLAFTLLADEHHAVAERYGVWVEKSMRGRTYFGNERTTFLIGPDGKVERIFRKVRPNQHDELVLGALADAA